MRKHYFLFIQIALFLLAAWQVALFCTKATDGFTLLKISSELSDDPRWETASDEKMLEQALFQNYSYLASGGQCFAFVSQDKRYVLKFLKPYPRARFNWLIKLPLTKHLKRRCQRQIDKRLEKMERDFKSYKLTFDELKEESGLLFVHLNKKENFPHVALITDKLGIKHAVSLKNTAFVLQKKAELVYPHLDSLIKERRLEEIKEAIRNIAQLISYRCDKGIFDEDAKIHRNFGFIDNRPIFVDVGRFIKDDSRKKSHVKQADIQKIMRPLIKRLEKQCPELVGEITS